MGLIVRYFNGLLLYIVFLELCEVIFILSVYLSSAAHFDLKTNRNKPFDLAL